MLGPDSSSVHIQNISAVLVNCTFFSPPTTTMQIISLQRLLSLLLLPHCIYTSLNLASIRFIEFYLHVPEGESKNNPQKAESLFGNRCFHPQGADLTYGDCVINCEPQHIPDTLKTYCPFPALLWFLCNCCSSLFLFYCCVETGTNHPKYSIITVCN